MFGVPPFIKQIDKCGHSAVGFIIGGQISH